MRQGRRIVFRLPFHQSWHHHLQHQDQRSSTPPTSITDHGGNCHPLIAEFHGHVPGIGFIITRLSLTPIIPVVEPHPTPSKLITLEISASELLTPDAIPQ
jgi:hypothetical protein